MMRRRSFGASEISSGKASNRLALLRLGKVLTKFNCLRVLFHEPAIDSNRVRR